MMLPWSSKFITVTVMSNKMNRTEGSKRIIDILDRLSNECNHQIALIEEADIFKNITEILVWLGAKYTTNSKGKKGQPITSDGIGMLDPDWPDVLANRLDEDNIYVGHSNEKGFFKIIDIDTSPLQEYIEENGILISDHSQHRSFYMIVGDYLFTAREENGEHSSNVISIDYVKKYGRYAYDQQDNISLVIGSYITITNPTHISMIKSWTLGNDVTLVK